MPRTCLLSRSPHPGPPYSFPGSRLRYSSAVPSYGLVSALDRLDTALLLAARLCPGSLQDSRWCAHSPGIQEAWLKRFVPAVDRSASDKDIRQAYKRLSRKYHPDKNQEPGAEEKFVDVAYCASRLLYPLLILLLKPIQPMKCCRMLL
jgi:hypothetical protein